VPPNECCLWRSCLERYCEREQRDSNLEDFFEFAVAATGGKTQRIAQVIAIDALPRSSIGKIRERELRERLKE
jgi:acyl-coenzyme A synthetase/AMP-(fatty) acid ligase